MAVIGLKVGLNNVWHDAFSAKIELG